MQNQMFKISPMICNHNYTKIIMHFWLKYEPMVLETAVETKNATSAESQNIKVVPRSGRYLNFE